MMRALRRLLAPDLHWSSALRIDQAAVHRSALITHEGEQARLLLDGRNVGNEGHWSLTVRAHYILFSEFGHFRPLTLGALPSLD